MLSDPTQRMLRFRDFLTWLVAGPGLLVSGGSDDEEAEEDEDEARTRAKLWVLLDIKIDDEPRALMRAIAAAIAQVPPSSAIPWEQRILLGCWNAALIEAASQALPGFPLAHIGYSLSYARHFFPVPDLAFNVAQAALLAPLRGRAFMRAVRARGRSLFVWTVNTERGMEWCIRQNQSSSSSSSSASSSSLRGPRLVDGVITDDPKLYLSVCRRYEDQLDGRATTPTRPATTRETMGFVMHVIARQLLFKFMFVYRRFWQNKLDYLHERAPIDKSD
ncbi:Lysophospholipase D gdpd1 [Purpureocillium takamizusanense]|uniref:Lysophospholipase D gdpd1 n=1 Tax=Purpureocillium takamizusanense TaxID=2060973 RepID=A0A9Q8V8I1_9HYPO|nr:Lysophospholipase D gdpd1 [Purpureocillium takamizusanense]UNI15827.1 Lysophospholipase D gdpd1 [Purpureocillium takamizusanense]